MAGHDIAPSNHDVTGNSEARPIYLNVVEAQRLAQKHSPRVVGIAFTLLGYSGHQPFAWNPAAIAKWLRSECADRITAAHVAAMKPALLDFFVELPDGRLTLNPTVFSAVDGNPGSQS